MAEPLLPIRHPNADFFIADIFDSIPVKCDRHTMEHPFFTLSTKPDIREVEYKRDGVTIKLSPHYRYGLPTMMDKDILLYIGSLLMCEINAGRLPPKTIRFSCHDLMITTNRMTNGQAYQQLKNAFERITGCLVTTSIKTKDIEASGGFHLLERYYVVKGSRDRSRMVEVEVTVSDWFYNALIGREVLTINRDYFRLRKPLERRLYELARKHCGRQPAWRIGLEALRDKCGALSPLRYFRFQLREIIHPKHERAQDEPTLPSPHFPDYHMTLDDQDMVTFTNRLELLTSQLRQSSARPATSPAPPLSAREALAPATLAKGRQLVEDAGTGWDYGALLEQFSAQLAKGFQPRNLNAAFLGFVRKKVQQRP